MWQTKCDNSNKSASETFANMVQLEDKYNYEARCQCKPWCKVQF